MVEGWKAPYHEFLADRLKDIIKQSRKMAIPNEPPIDTPKRKSLPDLGEKTAYVKTLDSKFIKTREYSRKKHTVLE